MFPMIIYYILDIILVLFLPLVLVNIRSPPKRSDLLPKIELALQINVFITKRAFYIFINSIPV